METSCHPAENVNESPIQWIIDVFVLVFAADLMNKKTCKTYSSELAVKYVLLCFFQNRKTGYKKKLNSFIQFPDTLDMKDHVKNGCIGKQLY